MTETVFNLSVTKKSKILVEYLTDTGSGFAITPEGDPVFLNQRLTRKMDVGEGDVYDAFLVPNYPDKRDQIPWRAIRVEPSESDDDLPPPEEDTRAKVLDYMSEYDGAWTYSQLAEALDMPSQEVKKILKDCIDDRKVKAVMAYVLCEETM